MYKRIIMLLFLIAILPSVVALDDIVQQNQPIDVRVTPVANGTINSVTTNITINDPDGIVIVAFQAMQKNLASQDFNYTLDGSNTSKLGNYDCAFYTFSNIAENKVFDCSFEVNPSGKDYIPQITGPLIFGAILTLMFTSILLFILGTHIELFPMKVFLLILSGIIAIMNLGFVAGSFQEFFSTGSSLSGVFGTLYIAFITMITAASIFLTIWIVVTGFKLWQVKRGFFIDEQ